MEGIMFNSGVFPTKVQKDYYNSEKPIVISHVDRK